MMNLKIHLLSYGYVLMWRSYTPRKPA